jgi:uncharacterized transporter YbjL
METESDGRCRTRRGEGRPDTTGDRTDIAFLAAGIAAGLLIGLLSVKVGSFAVTLGGAGGTLLVRLICG